MQGALGCDTRNRRTGNDRFNGGLAMRMANWVGAMLIGVCLTSPLLGAEHTKDTLDAVKKAVAADQALLLDVREKSEWDDGHLKDAKLLPLSVLKTDPKADEVAKIIPKDKVVYLHCGSGVRSLKASDELKKLGYDVRALKPGYSDLLEAGFPAAKK